MQPTNPDTWLPVAVQIPVVALFAFAVLKLVGVYQTSMQSLVASFLGSLNGQTGVLTNLCTGLATNTAKMEELIGVQTDLVKAMHDLEVTVISRIKET